MINYAHRGASEYAPENTMSSFYLGLLQGANGIETDIQKTKDGYLVLFHDSTVDRVTDSHGKISDYTLNELQKLKVYGNCTTGFFDRIVTLEVFLNTFSKYDIAFALELKGKGVEKETLELTEKYGVLDRTVFTSFEIDYIKKIKEFNKKAKVGLLTSIVNDDILRELKNIEAEQICPKAEIIDLQLIQRCKADRLDIRAWGVSNVSIMKKMCELKVDGMTVNFPDRLFEHLRGIYD